MKRSARQLGGRCHLVSRIARRASCRSFFGSLVLWQSTEMRWFPQLADATWNLLLGLPRRAPRRLLLLLVCLLDLQQSVEHIW